MLKEGEPAPDFSLPDQDDKIHSLSKYKGKHIVLYFYPRDMTPGCTQEACDFQQNLNRIKKKGAVVLGVSKDTVSSHQKFRKKHELSFPLLADVDESVCKGYGVIQDKVLYGRKFKGIVRMTFLIDSKGMIKKIYSKVRVTGHVDQVLKDLSK